MILGLKRRFDPADLKHFQFKEPAPEELADATPEMLADLHDLAKKFGKKDEYEHVCRFIMRCPKEISITVSIRPNNYSIVIIGPGGQTNSGANIIPLTSGYIVIWDRRVAVVDMEVLISEADKDAQEKGLIDEATGKRLPLLLRTTKPSKMSVEQIFRERGSVMPVLPGQNAEEMRQAFDQPEEVAITSVAFGAGQCLCHVRDLDFLEKRRQFGLAVLAERGFTSLEQIESLPMEKVLELREEIQRSWREQLGG